jgi:hypothetical protein
MESTGGGMRHFDPLAVSKNAAVKLKTKPYRTGFFEFWRACDITGSDHAINVLLYGKTNLRVNTVKLLFSMVENDKRKIVADIIKKKCNVRRENVFLQATDIMLPEVIMH